MGLSRAGFQNFQRAAQKTLEELFPGVVKIDGVEYAAAAVGGTGAAEYGEGGRLVKGVRFFRIDKLVLITPPKVGMAVEWLRAGGGEQVKLFTVMEVPDRPHETAWMLRCEPKQR